MRALSPTSSPQRHRHSCGRSHPPRHVPHRRGRRARWPHGQASRHHLAGVLVAVLVLVGVAVPTSTATALGDASSDSSAGASQGSNGAVTINVSVSYTQAQPGPGGGTGGGRATSRQVTATVLPVCYYKQDKNGREMADYLTRQAEERRARKKEEKGKKEREGDEADKDEAEDVGTGYPGWQDHADDTTGHWYTPTCDWSRMENLPQAIGTTTAYILTNSPVWVEAGAQPPEPLVDGATLASAAWDAVEIPTPQIEYNPTLGSRGATLVGWYTWVWATGDTPVTVEATATAGPVTATITAEADGLDLSAPDSQPECGGFGTPWQEGASGTDCTIVFTRSSAHLGGTTPLNTSVRYQVSYTATDGITGSLDSVTTTSSHDIPVAEAQTLNTNPDKQATDE